MVELLASKVPLLPGDFPYLSNEGAGPFCCGSAAALLLVFEGLDFLPFCGGEAEEKVFPSDCLLVVDSGGNSVRLLMVVRGSFVDSL